jgi:hypothetical protein
MSCGALSLTAVNLCDLDKLVFAFYVLLISRCHAEVRCSILRVDMICTYCVMSQNKSSQSGSDHMALRLKNEPNSPTLEDDVSYFHDQQTVKSRLVCRVHSFSLKRCMICKLSLRCQLQEVVEPFFSRSSIRDA